MLASSATRLSALPVNIHRSAIVNIDRISELRALPDGDFQVRLSTSAKLKMLRKYRDGLPQCTRVADIRDAMLISNS